MKMQQTRRNQFTLIELLVVIAIIAILASMLLPSLNKARHMAKGIKCTSNMKQSASAILLYTDDYDGFYPGYREDPTATSGDGYYLCAIARYGKIPAPDKDQIDKILHCPEFVPYSRTGYVLSGRTVYTNLTGVRDNPSNYYVHTTYSGSIALFSDVKVNGVLQHVQTARIRKPSEAFVLADGNDHTIKLWNQGWVVRHNRGMNLNFADGHAEFYKMNLPTGTICGSGIFAYPLATDLTKWPWTKSW